MSQPVAPSGESKYDLDIAAVMEELGKVHAQIASTGSSPVAAELAQLRVLVRMQQQRIADLERPSGD